MYTSIAKKRAAGSEGGRDSRVAGLARCGLACACAACRHGPSAHGARPRPGGLPGGPALRPAAALARGRRRQLHGRGGRALRGAQRAGGGGWDNEDTKEGLGWGLRGHTPALTPPAQGDGNKAVLAALAEAGAMLKQEAYAHKYPYDWRTKKPTIFRCGARPQTRVHLPIARHSLQARA